MNINWTNISQEEFLKNYWQQKPVVLKQAIENFEDPIDANDLAGLAMEEVVESRIVENVNKKWNVKHGPFADYDDLGENGWSLLVQGVDRWIPDVYSLRQLVGFIPEWSVDDVMVSYSALNGGVGAHLDQYDVFIIQGSGSRRWQVGSVDKSLMQKEIVQDLLQVETLTPIIDELLAPGDILYIPPFAPHCGETLSPSLSYSIGFRSPNQTELLTSFADFIYENELGKARFVNNTCKEEAPLNSALPMDTVTKLKDFMLKALDNNNFDRFLHQFLTEPTRELDIIPSEQEWSETQLIQLVQSGNTTINKVLALKTSYFLDDEGLHFYCNGTYFKLIDSQLDFVKLVHSEASLDKFNLKSSLNQLENISLLTTLINTGYLYIDE
ncbi:cupin domain-containing protein [Psychrosphaera aestuarii]|uniref:cupin domain-containing protein n=1 Tax=Psychrosphaera aestuarii TaxID=1266052 RepID=UPI001B31C82B|nr:cupin domain-containing protein [Psychrosphaera aestuarii]